MGSSSVGTINIRDFLRKRNAIVHAVGVGAVGVQETKAKRSISLPSYNTYQLNSPVGAVRDVAPFIHRTIPSTAYPLPDRFTDLDCVAAKAYFDGHPCILFSYYNHPDEPLNQEFFDYLSVLRLAVLLGYFNARHTDWIYQ